MAQTTSEIVVGKNGQLHIAAVGTTAPTAPDGAYAAGWVELGLGNADGAAVRDEKTQENIESWQLLYPSRVLVTGRRFVISMGLQQWNKDTFGFAFGGGEITEPSAGVFKYTPPDPEFRDERALGLSWQDGDKDYRILIPKGQIIDPVETTINRRSAAVLPVSFEVVPTGAGDPWYLLTNDPAFDPGA